MNVKLKQISGLAMAAVADSNHWIAMDGPEGLGGFSAGSRPMEVLLMGLAGCTAMDVISILRKKRVALTDFSLDVEATQAEQHPKVFTEIQLHYTFTGTDIRANDVEQAIELSENKYCSATAMLELSVKIAHDYRVVETSR
jgi:putative redox protein